MTRIRIGSATLGELDGSMEGIRDDADSGLLKPVEASAVKSLWTKLEAVMSNKSGGTVNLTKEELVVLRYQADMAASRLGDSIESSALCNAMYGLRDKCEVALKAQPEQAGNH